VRGSAFKTNILEEVNGFFLNIDAVPGTFFIYFVISLTIHTLFFLGTFFCWVFLSWVCDPAYGQIIIFLLGSREGCRAGIEPGTAGQQPSALTTSPRCKGLFLLSYLVPATLPSACIGQEEEKKDSVRSKDGGHTGCDSLEGSERELEPK
jgi:hypothetical protein